MNKYMFIAFIFTIAIIQNNLLSDQPNGEPWSEKFLMEHQHEGVETMRETFNVNESCGFFCEKYINELHEGHWEDEEDAEESEIDREFDSWWEMTFPEEFEPYEPPWF